MSLVSPNSSLQASISYYEGMPVSVPLTTNTTNGSGCSNNTEGNEAESFVILDNPDSCLSLCDEAAEEEKPKSLTITIGTVGEQPPATINLPTQMGRSAAATPEAISLASSIENRVQELIEENATLKATIEQNNQQLKKHLDKFHNWHGEVTQVTQDNKERYNELKEENAVLKNKLRKLDADYSKGTKEIEELIIKLAEAEQKQQQQQTKDNKDNQIEKQLNSELSKLKTDYEDSLKTIEQLQLELKDLKQSAKDSSVSKSQTIEENNTKHFEEVTMLKTQIEGYKQEQARLEATNAQINRDLTAKTSYLQMLELQHSAKIDETNKQFRELNGELDTAKKYIEQLRAENGNLAKQESVNKAQLDAVQQELVEWRVKGDEIAALKTQTTIFQEDFKNERKARTEAKMECNQLKEDLENLQRRNRELQEEIELIRVNSEFVVAPPPITRPVPNPQRVQRDNGMQCPICGVPFRDQQMLEAHATTCENYTD